MAKKRTTAQRRAAAKASWARRKAAAEGAAGDTGEVDETICSGYVLGVAGYHALAVELHAAFQQSAHGKGKERHANGRPFDRQPILELTRLYGPGFAAGQAAKKTQEALGMVARGETDKAIHEVHGAIVYLAAVAHFLRAGG